ncbi:Odorant-binding protein 42 isoform X2 [Halyomorpha halys]|nr:Odorant-binding protein 42 isoform X2 [Halyomorpha halys]
MMRMAQTKNKVPIFKVLSETFEEVKAACNKITGFDGDIDKLDYSDPAISEKVKCTVACAFEKHDMFKADGSIDKGKQKPLIEESVKDEEMKMKYLKAVEDCDASAKANKCDTAYEFLKCVDTKAEGTSK